MAVKSSKSMQINKNENRHSNYKINKISAYAQGKDWEDTPILISNCNVKNNSNYDIKIDLILNAIICQCSHQCKFIAKLNIQDKNVCNKVEYIKRYKCSNIWLIKTNFVK